MRRPSPRRRGMTLTEVMLGTAMIGIMATAMSSLIVTVQRSTASYEASSGIQLAAQQAVNRIFNTLIQSKKLFDASGTYSTGTTWLTALGSASAPSGGPAYLTNSQLPGIAVNGSFATSTSTFVGANNVGNELFFVSVDSSVALTLTIGASTQPATIDLEHFNLYYLAYSSGTLGGSKQIILQEWHSVSFADYQELTNLSVSSAAATLLYNMGVTRAVDNSAASAASGLYTINSSGAMSLMATPAIPLKYTQPMISIVTGISGSGYKYGVSPNTSSTFSTSYTVPVFAVSGAPCDTTLNGALACTSTLPASPFPAGFEVMISGANGGRQVFMRLVLVASGAFKGYKATAQTVSATVRDVY